ncbi:hypothetical protein KC19_4G083500 [Ceratodon purpureus]|nr:hypothetical protein KC19_4G083500 [Ceratodon purpureus]
MAESREFRTMLETKERELVALCDQQIQALNSQIREKETAVTELKDQLSQLQDDFKYNLGLLDARDAELAQYDVSTAALEASVTDSEERVKVARKALSDAETLRVQEKARADELEQISQQKISNLQKEIEGLQRSKEELQAKAKQELESAKTELKDFHSEKIEELEEEHKKELDETTKKWKEKLAKAEARLDESVENVESAEKRAETADEKCKNLKKELEAARAKQKEDEDAAAQHEKEHVTKEEELKSIIDKQNKELEDLGKQLNKTKENKDANVQAVDPPINIKEQLQELKAHHTAAVDLFKGEIDSLRNKLEGTANQTRTLETNLRKELEEKEREKKELEEKHKGLHDSYLDLQKELAGNRQREVIPPQGLVNFILRNGPVEGGSGSSSSYPAASPLMSPGLSHEDAIRINQGKLEAENSQLRAR